MEDWELRTANLRVVKEGRSKHLCSTYTDRHRLDRADGMRGRDEGGAMRAGRAGISSKRHPYSIVGIAARHTSGSPVAHASDDLQNRR